MYHCGVAIDTNYGLNSSGANIINTPRALINNFGYDKSLTLEARSFYSTSQWEDMVYDELSLRRPVLYSGQSQSGMGHAFICDGYTDGRFHINWGWGGEYDGYFLLTSTDSEQALSPAGSGIGGSDGANYSDDQAMVRGIKPDQGGDYVYRMKVINKLDIRGYSFENGLEYLSIGEECINTSFLTISCTIGLKFEDTSTGNIFYGEGMHHFSDVLPYETTWGISGCISDLPHGRYNVYPVFKIDGSDTWIDIWFDSETNPAPRLVWGDDLRCDFEKDGFFFNVLSKENHTCEITNEYFESKSYKGDVIIPSHVEYQGETYNVTTIGSKAFYICDEVTSVIIPEGVTIIDEYAFYFCPLRQVQMPQTLKTIKSFAFTSSGLETVAIPESVEYIGSFTFDNCVNLKSVDLKAKINSVPFSMFQGCISLTDWDNVKLSETITTLEHLSFCNTSFEEIHLQENITSTVAAPFQGCKKLKTFSLSAKFMLADGNPVPDCCNLESIIVDPSNQYVFSPSNCNALLRSILDSTVGIVLYDLIAGCKNTTILEGVSLINSYAN